MPTDYVIYSAVSINVSTPIVLGAVVTPPDTPTSGLVQTVSYDTGAEETWTLLPILQSNWYVLSHKLSGLCARFGPQDSQITLTPFVPFDQNFYIQLSGNAQNVQIISAAQPTLMFTVAGSSYTPPTAVNGSAFNQAQGQSWLFLPQVPEPS
jgi:hypothetical protein